MINLCDLRQPEEIYELIKVVLDGKRFIKGPVVDGFEIAWAERCKKKYAIATSNGAVALEIAIQALNTLYGKGEFVTYNPETFKAVPNAIQRMGLTPVPQHKQPDIYAHHLHDFVLDYIPKIEDCSHVHGYIPVAETAIFSFFPTKILGAVGDAGIIVTDSEEVRDECLRIRNHGEPDGTNGRMDEIQATALLAKLPHLDEWIKRRKEIVDMYDEGLGRKTEGQFHYAYCIPGSEEKKQKLIDMGVESNFYYTEEYMALPLHPYLTDEQVKEVIKCVQQL